MKKVIIGTLITQMIQANIMVVSIVIIIMTQNGLLEISDITVMNI